MPVRQRTRTPLAVLAALAEANMTAVTNVSVSDAMLFPGAGSVTPAGGATVAVFDRVPDAPEPIAALTV